MAGKVRFPHGPGTELDAVSDAYIAAIRAGDEAAIERCRAEVYRITGPPVRGRKGKRGQAGGR